MHIYVLCPNLLTHVLTLCAFFILCVCKSLLFVCFVSDVVIVNLFFERVYVPVCVMYTYSCVFWYMCMYICALCVCDLCVHVSVCV